jgi:hypothetical protein
VLRLLPALLAALAWPAAVWAQPTDAQGNVGRTSYESLPFQSQVFSPCWNCSPYLVPGELFFRANPASVFNDPTAMARARASAAALEAKGVLPASGAQRWQDTYAAAFPPGRFAADPAFAAWRDFIAGHPPYWDTAFDGGTMPGPTSPHPWGDQWGHISPYTPLDAADCPAGMAACTYGDLFAAQWAATARLTGAYAVSLSDFSDALPMRPSNWHDFNPRIVARFARESGLDVPAGDVPAQARWIVANALPAWNDFISRGYGNFFATLAARMGAATGRRALIVDACSQAPAFRRWTGPDARIVAGIIPPANYLCLWDEQVVRPERAGPVAAPPMQELAGAVVAAAREPLVRNGMTLEADDSAYWSAIARFYPTLDEAARRDVGFKLLKRLWLWSAWAHIADRDGHVRRALAFATRDYWDRGSVAALDPLTTLIQTIVPTQPFGPALYYSTDLERARERQDAARGPGAPIDFYLAGPVLQTFIDAGGVAGYYVSDAALPKIARGQTNAPSAWVVLDDRGMLPAVERARLAAIAPIVSSAAELAARPDQPLAFSGGLTGFGFYDQNHRLIVVVSNPGSRPDAGPLSGTIALSGLTGATYTATDLFSHATFAAAVGKGVATVPVTLARWDTRAFAFVTP